jgi:hypothetical protein
MADLEALQNFAAEHQFGLTYPLTHDQVVTLATYWQPESYFYVDERFHPISLDERIDMVESQFEQLQPEEREEWQVRKLIRTGVEVGRYQLFDPPVLTVPAGQVQDPDDEEGSLAPAVRVINDDITTRKAFESSAVDDDAVLTQGASARRARKFFGARRTPGGSSVGQPGDPLLPRVTDEQGNRVVTVMASYKNLVELLKYELLVEQAPDYPPDGLRGGSDIAESLFQGGPIPLPSSIRRQVLLDLIAAHEAGDNSLDTPGLPPGWELNKKAWDAVTRYAFLEYDYFYAYNDWERYQVALWDNEHEGDDEGCCLVFDRNIINLAAFSGNDNQLRRAVPHCIITCVHEEIQDADLFNFIPTPSAPVDNQDWLPRDELKVAVYVAGGSHATYLTPGIHDVVDFGDFWAYTEDAGTVLLAVPALPVLAVLAIIEHFQDTEDFTSDDGIRTGPPEVIGENPAAASRLVVMPMSADDHIYQDQNFDLLRLRAFAGKWGGHNGIIDRSPPFMVKTGRYFRKLLRNI